jgi:hypothetical protein
MALVPLICFFTFVAGMFAAVSEYKRQLRVGRKVWLARAEMISAMALFTVFTVALGGSALWAMSKGY